MTSTPSALDLRRWPSSAARPSWAAAWCSPQDSQQQHGRPGCHWGGGRGE
jgi:hypothetical protein